MTPYRGDPEITTLTMEICLQALATRSIGRIAVVEAGYPVVVPVHFRLFEIADAPRIAIRTKVGTVIDRAGIANVAFQVDDFDVERHDGWSVLVQGQLHHVALSPVAAITVDPKPWLPDRDSWLVIEPVSITGRRLHPSEPEWAFSRHAYL